MITLTISTHDIPLLVLILALGTIWAFYKKKSKDNDDDYFNHQSGAAPTA